MAWAGGSWSSAAAQEPRPLTRAAMARALQRDDVLEERHLDSVREVCRLTFDGRSYPVIATVERVTGIPEPRLYRHLVVLRPNLSKAYALTYDFGVQPTTCDGNRVRFTGGVVLADGEQGSIVQFAQGAADAWIVKAASAP